MRRGNNAEAQVFPAFFAEFVAGATPFCGNAQWDRPWLAAGVQHHRGTSAAVRPPSLIGPPTEDEIAAAAVVRLTRTTLACPGFPSPPNILPSVVENAKATTKVGVVRRRPTAARRRFSTIRRYFAGTMRASFAIFRCGRLAFLAIFGLARCFGGTR